MITLIVASTDINCLGRQIDGIMAAPAMKSVNAIFFCFLFSFFFFPLPFFSLSLSLSLSFFSHSATSVSANDC